MKSQEELQHQAVFRVYGTALPLESIQPDAIKHGIMGDCHFLSAVGSLAASNPASIKDMISDNADGTYTVTFPGAPDEPVVVTAPTQSEAGLYNHVGKLGTWATVLEKAYGAYRQARPLRRPLSNLDGGFTPSEGADGGGHPSNVIKLLTGRDSESASTFFSSKDTLEKKLTEAFVTCPGRIVTCETANNVFPKVLGGARSSADGFKNGHAYSVLGFSPDGRGGGTVTVRNPWGGQDGTTDGTVEIPLETLIRNFSTVTFQSR